MFPPFLDFDVCSSIGRAAAVLGSGLLTVRVHPHIIQFYRASFTKGDSLRDVRLSIALQWAG